MASATLDGATCTRASVLMPRVGVWTADVTLDVPTGPAGACVLAIDGVAWHGAVVEGGEDNGAWTGRIVGGAGGLRATLPALPIRGATLALVLSETLRAAGETQASDCGALDAVANWWARPEAPALHAVADVARASGYAWRVRADGTVWTGVEAWTAYTPTGAVDVLRSDPHVGRYELGGDVLGILPGQALTLPGLTVRVGCVEHLVSAGALRTVVLAERETGTSGRLLEALDAIVRRITRRTDHLALYPATVRAQTGDLLDVVADDPRLAIPARIPYRTMLGVTLAVPVGARVLVGFEGGDPARPVALLWETGTATTVRVNGGTLAVARATDPVGAATTPPGPTSMAGWITAVTGALNGILGPGTIAPPVTFGTITSGAPGFEA